MGQRTRQLPTAAELGIDDVLHLIREIYQLRIEERHDEAYFLCPVHDDHKASASVNLKSGYWSCWSCSAGGDIINLGCRVLKMSRMLLELTLRPDDPDARRAAIIRTCEARKGVQGHKEEDETVVDRIQDPAEFEDGPMDYMYDRGFKNRTLLLFGIRYVKSTHVRTKRNKLMKIRESIAIPIHNETGEELVGWCFRATPKSPEYQPRYFYTTGSKVSEFLFAEHLCTGKKVIVTEGAIDAMWITQAGYHATAVLGASNVGPAKVDRLSDFSNVVIFGDRNLAGVQFVNRLGELLRPHTSVTIARYRRSWTGNDPNELSVQQVSDAIERAIPFHEWRAAS